VPEMVSVCRGHSGSESGCRVCRHWENVLIDSSASRLWIGDFVLGVRTSFPGIVMERFD